MSERSDKARLRAVVAAVIEKAGKVLVARRRQGLRFGGLWEFPGGKLEVGEDPKKGLERELAEEFGVRSRAGKLLCAAPFQSPALSIELRAYRVAHVAGEFRPVDHDELRWLPPAEMDESVFTAPDRPVVRLLRAEAARKARHSSPFPGGGKRDCGGRLRRKL